MKSCILCTLHRDGVLCLTIYYPVSSTLASSMMLLHEMARYIIATSSKLKSIQSTTPSLLHYNVLIVFNSGETSFCLWFPYLHPNNPRCGQGENPLPRHAVPPRGRRRLQESGCSTRYNHEHEEVY